jgi:hypothetical protein
MIDSKIFSLLGKINLTPQGQSAILYPSPLTATEPNAPMKFIKLIKNPPDWLAVIILTVGIVAYLVGLGVLRNFIHS